MTSIVFRPVVGHRVKLYWKPFLEICSIVAIEWNSHFDSSSVKVFVANSRNKSFLVVKP